MDTHPKYATLNTPKIVGADEGVKVIPQDAAFISYLQNETHVTAFIIDPENGLSVIDLGDIPKLDEIIGTYREALSHADISSLKSNGKCLWLLPLPDDPRQNLFIGSG